MNMNMTPEQQKEQLMLMLDGYQAILKIVGESYEKGQKYPVLNDIVAIVSLSLDRAMIALANLQS
jgi:hypothetical protein